MKSNVFNATAPPELQSGKKQSNKNQRGQGSGLIGGIDAGGEQWVTATQIQNSGEKSDIGGGTHAGKKLLSTGDESFGLGVTPLDRMRRGLKAKGANGMLGLMRQFKLADDDGSKSLSQEEFAKAIKVYGLDITDPEMVELFNKFDEDKSGYIEYEEFARQIMRKKMPKRCTDLVDLAFQKIDKDGSGIIDLNDVMGVYDTSLHPDLLSGKKTESEILTELLQAFDVGGEVDGKVSRDEFQNYYDYLYINIPSDDYFELMIRNAWHISGGEGACASSANRRVLVTNADGSESVVEIKDDLGLKADDKKGMVARLRAQGVAAASIELSSGAGDQEEKGNTKPKKPPPFRGLSKAFTGSSTKDEYAPSANQKNFSRPNDGSLGRPGSSGFQDLSSSVKKSMRSQRKVTMNVPPPAVDANAAVNSNHPMLLKLKEKLASRGARGIAGLSRAFKRMDNDGNKSLNFAEFSQALSEMGLALQEPEKRQLFLFFDKDRSQSVSYDELLVSLRGQLNERRRALVHLAFKKIDKDGNGELDVQDVISTYDASKHPDVIAGKRSAGEVLREFLDTFDVGGEKDGKVSIQEFENYYGNISASIDDDDYFELMIRNAWHISGGTGQCANSANRRVLVTRADGSRGVVEIKNDLGLKADDKKGMVNRLKQQGEDVDSVELFSGSDDTSNPTKLTKEELEKKNSAGAAVMHARKVHKARALRMEKKRHEFVELEEDPREEQTGASTMAFSGMEIGGLVVKSVKAPVEESHTYPPHPPSLTNKPSHLLGNEAADEGRQSIPYIQHSSQSQPPMHYTTLYCAVAVSFLTGHSWYY